MPEDGRPPWMLSVIDELIVVESLNGNEPHPTGWLLVDLNKAANLYELPQGRPKDDKESRG